MTFDPPRVEIVQTDESKKGRAFGAHLLASVEADGCWDAGNHDGHRPVYASFVASEAEMPAFEANLREGRACAPAKTGHGRAPASDRLSFPASAEHVWTRQRTSDGVVLTAHLPALFLHDPGFVDPDEARLVVLPTRAWADAQRAAMGEREVARAMAHVAACGLLARPDLNERLHMSTEAREYEARWRADYTAAVERMIPTAMLFVAALDRRTRFPILADPAFGLQLFLALHVATVQRRPLALSRLSSRLSSDAPRDAWVERGTDDVGLAPGACLAASHEHLDTVLVREVKRYREAPRAAAPTTKRAARSKQRAA